MFWEHGLVMEPLVTELYLFQSLAIFFLSIQYSCKSNAEWNGQRKMGVAYPDKKAQFLDAHIPECFPSPFSTSPVAFIQDQLTLCPTYF